MSRNWSKIGRLIYGIPLILVGFIYVCNPQGALETLTSFIPGDLGLIYVAGVMWVILGSMIVFNIKAEYASFGVIGLLSAYQIMVHVPAVYTGEYLTVVWFELLRDVSLIGGAFFIIAMQNYQVLEQKDEKDKEQDWRVSVH
jgi:uncharacterized membrane protein YphA (DoxX/SURF4 family)